MEIHQWLALAKRLNRHRHRIRNPSQCQNLHQNRLPIGGKRSQKSNGRTHRPWHLLGAFHLFTNGGLIMDEFEIYQDDLEAWELRQLDDDYWYELQMNFEDMQKEANLVSWGAEYLDEVDHDW
jgi:hypothetical protein